MSDHSRVWAWFWITCSLGLAGCAVGPDFTRPQAPAVDRYTYGTASSSTVSAEGRPQRFEPEAEVVCEWWRLFRSHELDEAVIEAVNNSPNLQAAQSALRQSRYLLRAGYGVFYPSLDAKYDATKQKFSPVGIGGTGSTIFELYTLSTTVSYALDVFGGERRAVEGLKAQADYQGYTVLGVYLTLTGNVVNAVIARAAYREEIKATEQIADAIREQVGLTEVQAQAGIAPYTSVLSLRSQLAAIEATLPALRQRAVQAEHLLATLSGRAPSEMEPPQVELADLTLPADLPVTLPSDLVRQRPDILAAEAQAHQATAEIGVATAALFPSFTLTGTYGLNNISMNDLFRNRSSFWNIGANVGAPLFRGGSLWFQRKAAVEGYRAALAVYRQTVLDAFGQVADTLRALEHDAEVLASQSQSLAAAEENARLIQANYQAGVAGYLQMLIANAQYHQAKIGYLQAQAQRFQDTVALFVALGGGWWNAKGNVLGGLSNRDTSQLEGIGRQSMGPCCPTSGAGREGGGDE